MLFLILYFYLFIIKLHAPEKAFQHTITIKRLKICYYIHAVKNGRYRYNVQLFKMCFFTSDLKCLIILNDLIESMFGRAIMKSFLAIVCI
jgi:hypothetical protein